MSARVVRCKRCDGHTDVVGDLSARKLCRGCGETANLANAVQISERQGPYYDRWRRQTILALLDLDTAPDTSLDLISDSTLRMLLAGAESNAERPTG